MPPRFIKAGRINARGPRIVGGGDTSFSYPTIPDAQYALWLRGEEADESQTITDDGYYSHTCTAVGNTKNDTAEKKWGNGSLYFDGTGDYLTAPAHSIWDFASKDWTVEFWMYDESGVGSTKPVIFDHINGLNDEIKISHNGLSLSAEVTNSSGTQTSVSGGVVVNDVWTHVRLSLSGVDLSLYMDGASIDTDSFTGSLDLSSTILHVGHNATSGTSNFGGWIDDLLVINGTAIGEGYPEQGADGPLTLGNAVEDNSVVVVDNGIPVVNT